ncbi:MAG: phage tail protein [Janthinobacterium lividum]
MDEFIGIVKLFAGTFAPRGWALCDGSLLNISQNTALFSILGTTYGGNGTQTFALPDLRGRVAVGAGSGPGQQPVQPGQLSGSANVTLTTQQLPQHTHAQQFANVPATTNSPAGNVLAQVLASDGDGIALTTNAYAPSASLVAGSPTAIGMTGNNQPLSVMQPYLGMNYIICLEGVFPSRN